MSLKKKKGKNKQKTNKQKAEKRNKGRKRGLLLQRALSYAPKLL